MSKGRRDELRMKKTRKAIKRRRQLCSNYFSKDEHEGDKFKEESQSVMDQRRSMKVAGKDSREESVDGKYRENPRTKEQEHIRQQIAFVFKLSKGCIAHFTFSLPLVDHQKSDKKDLQRPGHQAIVSSRPL